MAAQNTVPAPIRITYPADGQLQALPTAVGNNPQPPNARVKALFDRIVQQNSPHDLSLPPSELPQGDQTCYRNALITMLFNLNPFLKFLRYAADADGTNTDDTDTDNAFFRLKRAANAYWREPSPDQIKLLSRRIRAWARYAMKVPGDEFMGGMAQQSWSDRVAQGTQADVTEFLHHIFDLIGLTNFQNDDRKDILDLLFKVQLVSRRAYTCGCNEKNRQNFGANDTDAWWFTIGAPDFQAPLSTLMANALYDDNSDFKGTCPSCGTQNIRFYQYQKFKQLPEVLLVDISHNPTPGQQLPDQYPSASAQLPDSIDLAAVQDVQTGSVQPNGDNQVAGEPTVYKLQALIAYGGSGDVGHYYSIVRRSVNDWVSVDDSSDTPITTNPNGIVLVNTFRPRLLAYVRVRPNDEATGNSGNDTAIDQSDRPKQPTPQPTSQPAPQPASNEKTYDQQSAGNLPTDQQPQRSPERSQPVSAAKDTNDRTSPSPPDTSTWKAQQFHSHFKGRGISTLNYRNIEKLRARLDSYYSADQIGKLDYLLKPELLRQARSVGLNPSPNDSRTTLIDQLTRHLQSTSRVDATTTVPNTDQPSTSTDPVNASNSQSVPAKTTGPAKAPTQQSAAQNVTDTAQLQAENDRLRNEINNLKSQVSQLTQQLQTFQSQVATLQQERDNAGNRAQQPEGAGASPRATTPPNNQTSAPDQSLPTNDGDQSRQNQGSTLNQQDSPSAARTPLGTQYCTRILKVTTKDIVFIDTDDATADPSQSRDHHKYISIPYYVSGQHLVTRQWPQLVTYTVPNSIQKGASHAKFVVYVAIQDQNSSNDAIHSYDILLGPVGKSKPPLPRLEVDMVSAYDATQVKDEIDQGVNTIRPQPVPAQLLVTPQLKLDVQVLPQSSANSSNGHDKAKATFTVSLPGHNPDEVSASRVSVRMTDAYGGLMNIRQWWSDSSSDAINVTNVYTNLQRPDASKPAISTIPGDSSTLAAPPTGVTRRFTEAFGDDLDDGERPKKTLKTTTTDSAGTLEEDTLGVPDNVPDTPGNVQPPRSPPPTTSSLPPRQPQPHSASRATSNNETTQGDGLDTLFEGSITGFTPIPGTIRPSPFIQDSQRQPSGPSPLQNAPLTPNQRPSSPDSLALSPSPTGWTNIWDTTGSSSPERDMERGIPHYDAGPGHQPPQPPRRLLTEAELDAGAGQGIFNVAATAAAYLAAKKTRAAEKSNVVEDEEDAVDWGNSTLRSDKIIE